MSKLYKKISVVDLEELILSVKNLPVELDKNQFKIKKVRKTNNAYRKFLINVLS